MVIAYSKLYNLFTYEYSVGIRWLVDFILLVALVASKWSHIVICKTGNVQKAKQICWHSQHVKIYEQLNKDTRKTCNVYNEWHTTGPAWCCSLPIVSCQCLMISLRNIVGYETWNKYCEVIQFTSSDPLYGRTDKSTEAEIKLNL